VEWQFQMPSFILALTVATIAHLHMHTLMHGQQCVVSNVTNKHNGSATAAMAAIRSTMCFALFASKGNATGTAITAHDVNVCRVEKFPFRVISCRHGSFDAAFVVVFKVVVVDVLSLLLTCLSTSYTSEDSTPITPIDVVDDDFEMTTQYYC
jgi:hypothetical protein